MARMIPELSVEQLSQLQSRAEANFYLECRDQLPDDVLVIYSVSWIYRDGLGKIREGEADFTIACPQWGVLAVEVKGGGVAFDVRSGQWSSVDRRGERHPIKDPFRQAAKERHALLDQLKGHPAWRQWTGRRFTLGHAVMLPDVHDAQSVEGPDRPRAIIGVHGNMGALSSWYERVMKFWRQRDDDVFGPKGVRLLEEILCRPVEVQPILVSHLEDVERQRIRLTANQAKVLRILGGRKRVVISGGAGTGKTLIALEKARQLAQAGLTVLLLCYNRPLADTLARSATAEDRLHVMNFHQLCDHRMALARARTGRDLLVEAEDAYPGDAERHRFDVQVPFALALSNEVVDEKYDAVIVDEAQDFSDEYWFALVDLLRDEKDGYLYIFIDENQKLYKRSGSLPITDEPFYLTANCRNTSAIHDLGYLYYHGEPIDRPELVGPMVEFCSKQGDAAQADYVARRVQDLLIRDRLSPSDIVVLVAKRPKANAYDMLVVHPLPAGTRWTVEVYGIATAVLVDTVARFKGLESTAVVLWVGDEVVDGGEWETLYVGSTRAKSLLCVVASARTVDAFRKPAEPAK